MKNMPCIEREQKVAFRNSLPQSKLGNTSKKKKKKSHNEADFTITPITGIRSQELQSQVNSTICYS